MLKDTYPYVERNLKSRITRMTKKLENKNATEEVEYSTDENDRFGSNTSLNIQNVWRNNKQTN